MNIPTFSEAIKVKDGVFCHVSFHQERMDRTTLHFFGRRIDLDLTPETVPPDKRTGIYKCRIVYSDHIRSIEFIPYSFRVIRSMALITDNTVDYSYKSTDRDRLTFLLKESGCDEIILIKNGFVTDSSSSNLVFRDETGFYTPYTYLLQGTQRTRLLREGVIRERKISCEDIATYSEVYLINAMTGLEDRVSFPVKELFSGENKK